MALGIVAKGLLGAGKVVGKGVGLAGRGAMMAGRTGMALRGRKKKINTSKLMGREGGEEKGGALAIRPSSNIVSSPGGAIQKIEKTEKTDSKGNALLVIKTKLVSIDTILKGTLAAEKKAENDKRKAQERLERKEDEKELEDDSKDGKKAKKFKLAPPKQVLSFWEKIKSYFGKVLFGWLAVRLIDWLPKLMPILKFLAGFADFIIKVGGILLNALVTFVDWGYKAVSATRGFVKNLFGEKGAKAFDSIVGHLNKLFNVIAAIALGVLAVGNESKKQKQDDINKRTKKKPKLKERYERRQKFKQQKKRIQRKKFFKKRTPKALRKTIQRGKITAKKFARKLKKTPQKITKNISKNLTKTTKNISKNLGKTTQAVSKNVGKATKAVSKTTQAVGKNISKVSGKVSQSAGKIVSRLGMKMNSGMVQSMKGISKMAKGVRIPIVGPLLAALTSYLADGKWDKALFIGVGTALGEMLGTAIPIPVLGTLLGGAIGYYIGDLLYTLFRGGGVGELLNKLKKDLKKVFNVGKAIFDWSKMGLGRLWEGLPKVFGVPNPAWLFNPLNMVDKAKLIGKAFFSRDPMKEEKDDKKGDEKKKDTKKLDKMFKMGKKEFDLSQLQGGLTNEEYDALSNVERSRLNSRLQVYRNQNKEEWAANIKGNANNGKKISSVEAYASYENGGEEVVVIPPQENAETSSQPEKGTVYPVMTGSGSGGSDEISARLYERG
jgi:hypothetical protein